MRHRKVSRRLSRTTAHRQAMMRNLVTSFLENERVVTTDAKAKELRPLAERMITLGKRGDLAARRQALTIIRRREVVEKVFSDLGDRYRDRPGGYLRITKLGQRRGDAAPVSMVELLPAGATKAPRKKSAKPKPKPKAKTAAKATAKPEAAPPAEAAPAQAAEDEAAKPKKKAPAKKKAAGDEAAEPKKKAPAKKKAAAPAADDKPKKKAPAKKKAAEDEAAKPKKKAPAKKKAAGDETAKPKKKAAAKTTKAAKDE